MSREVCPVHVDAEGVVQVDGHALVEQVALDDLTFSSDVSRFLQVPNGLDGSEHTAYRALIDRYMTTAEVASLREETERIAGDVVAEVLENGPTVDAVDLGAAFAVRGSCAWLGWPRSLEPELLSWVHSNWEATRSGELEETARVANWYNDIIVPLLEYRREHKVDDVTSRLMADTSLGRPLGQEEIISILRNWTGGDLGSMALCVGVVLAYLADSPALQQHLREGASDSEWKAVLDEILRLDDPFLANRRVATAEAQLGDVTVEQGQRLRLNWTAANTDPEVFEEAQFDPAQNADKNLVYGIGRHVCPGRDLATMQLQAVIKAALAQTEAVEPARDKERLRSEPPAGGYASVPVILR